MSVRQSTQNELRYLKRQNLEEEAKIQGNYYRDIIRSYGIDCNYYRLSTDWFDNFKNIIDSNAILREAYGYPVQKDYSMSADMITFCEVQADIFNLNKYGIIPNQDVFFYFDTIDFACKFAEKYGQLKEYPIDETEICCEVPDVVPELFLDGAHYLTSDNWIELENLPGKTILISVDNKISTVQNIPYVSSYTFPYNLGDGKREQFTCGILSGNLSLKIDGYELSVEQTKLVNIYEHTDFLVDFPVNDTIYKSFYHRIQNTDYIDSLIYLTFTVTQESVDISSDNGPLYKNILRGKLHGSILFYDLNRIGKYLDIIHPMIGDIITIDFPNCSSREQYEITDCFDKQLTTDGISPLLHKYIWKCSARRYINTYEPMEYNEDNSRLEEQHEKNAIIKEEVAKKISLYDTNDYTDDSAYGGYDGVQDEYDKQKPTHGDVNSNQKRINVDDEYEYLDQSTAIDILVFHSKSKLCTDGYNLYFVEAGGDVHKLTFESRPYTLFENEALFEKQLRFLKATDNCVVFVNILGESFKLAENEIATQNELEICLNDLYESTLDVDHNINQDGNNFYKFKETKTILFATETNLFCRLASNKKLYKLA